MPMSAMHRCDGMPSGSLSCRSLGMRCNGYPRLAIRHSSPTLLLSLSLSFSCSQWVCCCPAIAAIISPAGWPATHTFLCWIAIAVLVSLQHRNRDGGAYVTACVLLDASFPLSFGSVQDEQEEESVLSLIACVRAWLHVLPERKGKETTLVYWNARHLRNGGTKGRRIKWRLDVLMLQGSYKEEEEQKKREWLCVLSVDHMSFTRCNWNLNRVCVVRRELST